MILAVDPGGSVGYARFEDDGSFIDKGKMSEDFFINTFLASYVTTFCTTGQVLIKTIVCEDFALRKDKALAQAGSKMQASQVIGAVKLASKLLGTELIFQPPSNLRAGLKRAGYREYLNRHPPDDIAAHAHGVFYLIEEKIIRHPLLD